MLGRLMDTVEPAFSASNAQSACAAFYDAMTCEGATYFQARVYRRPGAPLNSANHFAAGGRIFVVAPGGWPTSEAGRYICFENNPLLAAIRENRTRYAFSDFAPKADRRFGRYWEALREARIGEGLCATSYGADNVIASIHLGFESREPARQEALAFQLAGLMLTERLIDLARPPAADPPVLTARERDALAYVAEGKTDWEISVILGVSEATARFHVDNGRRKLDAVNRAQAVAKLAARRVI